jgi:hypothetical protein
MIKPFVFVELPAKLRLRIFSHLLILRRGDLSGRERRVIMEGGQPFGPLDSLYLTILGTCRQLRDEGCHYLYNENKFELELNLGRTPHNEIDVADVVPFRWLHAPSLCALRVTIKLCGDFKS